MKKIVEVITQPLSVEAEFEVESDDRGDKAVNVSAV